MLEEVAGRPPAPIPQGAVDTAKRRDRVRARAHRLSLIFLGFGAIFAAVSGLSFRTSIMTPFIIAIAIVGIALGIAVHRFPEFRNFPPWRRKPAEPAEWQSRSLHDLSTAEDLMDLLETRGTKERVLVIHGNDEFEIRWR
jgi:hypothetical protein